MRKVWYYTRYSDDMAFSTSLSSFNRRTAVTFVTKIFDIMRRTGFRPHTSKTVIAPPGARKVVLGLLVDRDTPRLRHELGQDLSSISTSWRNLVLWHMLLSATLIQFGSQESPARIAELCQGDRTRVRRTVVEPFPSD